MGYHLKCVKNEDKVRKEENVVYSYLYFSLSYKRRNKNIICERFIKFLLFNDRYHVLNIDIHFCFIRNLV